VVQVISGAHGS